MYSLMTTVVLGIQCSYATKKMSLYKQYSDMIESFVQIPGYISSDAKSTSHGLS